MLVINTLIGSLFVYKMSVLALLNVDQINMINVKIKNFLWHGKGMKIDLNTLCKKKTQGGLKLVNLEVKQRALQISWIFRLQKDPFLEQCAYSQLSPALGPLIWLCNLKKQDVAKMFGQNIWAKILVAWSTINYFVPMSRDEIMHQLLWANSFIRVNNTPIIWRHWIQKDIVRVKDIVNENGDLNCQLYNLNWLEVQQLGKALLQEWWSALKSLTVIDDDEFVPLYDRLQQNKNVSQTVYNMCIDDPFYVTRYLTRWQSENVYIEEVNYVKCFENIRKCTNSPKMIDFQYRLLLKKLVTNGDLENWGKEVSASCTFGCGHRETHVHLLYECECIQGIINLIKRICDESALEYEFNAANFMFNCITKNTRHVVNYVMIFAKQFIYKCRCQ